MPKGKLTMYRSTLIGLALLVLTHATAAYADDVDVCSKGSDDEKILVWSKYQTEGPFC